MFEYMQYNIAPWPGLLAMYFFLIGTAAAVFVVAAAPNVFGAIADPFKNFQKTGMIVTLALLAISAPLLIIDLGQPTRFLNTIIYFHWTSPLSWGALFLPLFGLSILAFLYGIIANRADILKWSGIAGSLLALSMPLYTGMDLMVQTSRELWANPVIPVLFVTLSITSGVALVAIIEVIVGGMNEAVTRLLRICLYFSLGVTFWLFFGIVVTLVFGGAEQQQVWNIINEQFAIKFWFLTFAIGIIAPLLLLIPPKLASNNMVVALAGILGAVGAYTFREVLVLAGQLPQLYY